MSEPGHLETGVYTVDAPCPSCGAIEPILVGISSVLTTPTDEPASIKVKLKGKPRDHDCQQRRFSDLTLTDVEDAK